MAPDDLISAHFDGLLDEQQAEELQSWLESAREHFEYFLRQGSLHYQLHGGMARDEGGAAELQPTGSDALGQLGAVCATPSEDSLLTELYGRLPHEPSSRLTSPRFWIVVSLLTTVFLSGLYLLVGEGWQAREIAQPVEQRKTAEPFVPPIAVLVVGMADCQWASGSPTLQLGSYAAIDEQYELRSGLLKFVVDRKTRCVLEGPVVFRVISADAIRLERGRLAAIVPTSAVGFTVRTPQADVTDLGTEFGVEVAEDGTLNTHVFEGAVLLSTRPPENSTVGVSTMVLSAGESALVAVSGELRQGAGCPIRIARLGLSHNGNDIIVDDTEAEMVGHWIQGSSVPGFVGKGYSHDGDEEKGTKSIRFRARLPKAGRYAVQLAFPTHANRATNTPVTVHHADGSKRILVDQRAELAGGKKVLLGAFRFDLSTDACVEISTEDTDGYVIADTVQWRFLEPSDGSNGAQQNSDTP